MNEDKATILDISHEFYSGNYDFVLQLIEDQKNNPSVSLMGNEEVVAMEIGARVFKGQLREAQLNYDKFFLENKVTDIFQVKAQFFLAIGRVRSSDYKLATHYFAKNMLMIKKLRKKKKKSNLHNEEMFYAFQGAAFYHFFKGQYQKTILHSEYSYELAYNLEYIYGQVLALDLLGHSLCQIGHIRKGLYELEKAEQLAIKLGNGGLETSIKISQIKYKAHYGVDLKNNLKELEKGIESLKAQDTYSKVELYLELVRQLLLRGEGARAQDYLEHASEMVYKHQNKRQLATYNLRYAHLLLLRGEKHAAKALVQSLKVNLNPTVDVIIIGQANGLYEKIEQTLLALNLKCKKSNDSEKEYDLTNSSNLLDMRIKNRQAKNKNLIFNRGEDPLGDIIDDVYRLGVGAIEVVKENLLYGLLPTIFNIPQGGSGIYLGPGRNEIILVNGADVAYITKGITSTMKKLLLLLRGPGHKSKEWLVSKTWNYIYDPAVHDSLLYGTIAKIRKYLQTFSYWIEWSNDGYKLADFVQVYGEGETAQSKPLIIPSFENLTESAVKEISHSFNLRQLKLLKKLKDNEFIGVDQYAKIYKICTMTAYRDLSGLHQNGKLIKLGRARGTLYGKMENQ